MLENVKKPDAFIQCGKCDRCGVTTIIFKQGENRYCKACRKKVLAAEKRGALNPEAAVCSK
jgi:hypothetical protein